MALKTRIGVCEECSKQAKNYWVHKRWICNACAEKFWKSMERTNFTPNEYITNGDMTQISIHNRENQLIGYALIDPEDIPKVNMYKWGVNSEGYIVTGGNKANGYKHIKMHDLLIDVPEKCFVDHINHNPYDNRKCNLRVCTLQQNNYNRGLRKDNKTGVRGVAFDPASMKWMASIGCNGKHYTIGRYNTFDEAVAARLAAEKEYFGEFAPSFNDI